jgi:hypothetical protein
MKIMILAVAALVATTFSAAADQIPNNGGVVLSEQARTDADGDSVGSSGIGNNVSESATQEPGRPQGDGEVDEYSGFFGVSDRTWLDVEIQ